MTWLSGLAWLASRRAQREGVGDDDEDRAGMGTAFGLDASMSPPDDAGGKAGTPSHGMTQPPAGLPWEHRLTRRSGL